QRWWTLVGKTLRRDADDCVRLIFEQYLFADDVWIAREALLPECVTDDRYGSRSGLVVFGREVAPEHRRRAHYFEVIGSDHARVEVLGFVGAAEVYGPAAKERDRFEDLVTLAPVDEVWIRELAVLDLRSRLVHPHDAIGFRIRQRLQQHGIDHAEHRRVHTDADREHEHRQ